MDLQVGLVGWAGIGLAEWWEENGSEYEYSISKVMSMTRNCVRVCACVCARVCVCVRVRVRVPGGDRALAENW